MIWVYVTNEGCVNMDTAYINFIKYPIGMDEKFSSPTYRIYPNPANEFVTVESLALFDQEFSIELFDLRGETLIQSSDHKYKTEVKLNGIPAGFYLLQISGETGVYRFRLIHP